MQTSTRVLLLLAAFLPCAPLFAQGTLERIAERGEFRIGYRTDARPLSFEEGGKPAGYSVDICKRIAVGVKEHLQLPELKVTYVKVTAENRFDAVVNGDVDIECGATTVTLGRQERVDFTLMTFVTGGSILSMEKHEIREMKDLDGKRIAVMRNTTTAGALEEFLKDQLIDARIVGVGDRDAGMELLQSGEVDAFASDQIVLIGEVMEALERRQKADFSFAQELFSYEPYALVVRRNDADFRLVANRSIAKLLRDGEHARLFQTWIGSAGIAPSTMLLSMYQVQSLSE